MQIIYDYKIYLERLGYSKNSIYMLPKCVQEFLEVQQINNLKQIIPSDIVRHHEYLQTRPNKRRPGGLSESHINHHIYALKTFFKWLEETGKLNINPISPLEFPSPKSKPREILTQEEIKALYEATETYRERAVLSLYYGCGLRRTEGIQLDVKDVHLRTGLLYVRAGKGAKRRVVPLSQKVAEDLKNYLHKERRAKLGETALLTGEMGNRINPETTVRELKNLLQKANIEKHLPDGKAGISLHHLRHSIATHLLASGLSVENVREFLGHSNLETTQIYTRVNNQQLWNLKTI